MILKNQVGRPRKFFGETNSNLPGRSEGTAYIYSLTDPRDNTLRYIGVTVNPRRRIGDHIRETSAVHTYCGRWLKGLLDSGNYPTMTILETFPETDWVEREKHWIAEMLTAGASLTNAVEGGNGGVNRSPESIARQVASLQKHLQDPVFREKFTAPIKAYVESLSPEEKAERTSAMRKSPKRIEGIRRYHSNLSKEELRARFSHLHTPDVLARRQESFRAYIDTLTPEQKMKRMEGAHNPGSKAKVAAAVKSAFSLGSDALNNRNRSIKDSHQKRSEKINQERYKRIKPLLDTGKSYTQIAEILGVDRKAVSRAIKYVTSHAAPEQSPSEDA